MAGRRRPVPGSRTGRPIMVLLDLLGQRWTLRVLWELREGALTFRALQTACDGVSPTVLSSRLAELRDADLVEHEDGVGYRLTRLGASLGAQLLELSHWAEAWAAERDGPPPSQGPPRR